MTLHSNQLDLSIALERHEAEAWRCFAASAANTVGNPLGAISESRHIVPLTAMTSINFAGFNRVIGLGVGNTPSITDIDDILAFFETHNQTRFAIEMVPNTTPPDLEQLLLLRGFHPDPLTIVKSWRTITDLPERRIGVPVVVLGVGQADDWSKLHRSVREAPRMFGQWFSAAFGHPSFVHLGVYDGDELVAGAAMFVSDGLAWCGFAATLETHRGRGLQTAIAIERFYLARDLGCHTAHVENDPDTDQGPCVALRNMRNIGFQLLYEKKNLLSPN